MFFHYLCGSINKKFMMRNYLFLIFFGTFLRTVNYMTSTVDDTLDSFLQEFGFSAFFHCFFDGAVELFNCMLTKFYHAYIIYIYADCCRCYDYDRDEPPTMPEVWSDINIQGSYRTFYFA